jgi:hypothetical protein
MSVNKWIERWAEVKTEKVPSKIERIPKESEVLLAFKG